MMNVISALLLPSVRRDLEQTRWVAAAVGAHRERLVGLAMEEGLLAEEAFDAVQEGIATFLARPGWRELRDQPEQVRRLLATLVRNQARNARRRHARRDLPLDQLPPEHEADRRWGELDDTLDEAQQHLQLTGCLSTLKETQRAIVTARFFEGATGQQIARELGLAPGNVAVILHRAREKLRACLQTSRRRFGSPRAA